MIFFQKNPLDQSATAASTTYAFTDVHVHSHLHEAPAGDSGPFVHNFGRSRCTKHRPRPADTDELGVLRCDFRTSCRWQYRWQLPDWRKLHECSSKKKPFPLPSIMNALHDRGHSLPQVTIPSNGTSSVRARPAHGHPRHEGSLVLRMNGRLCMHASRRHSHRHAPGIRSESSRRDGLCPCRRRSRRRRPTHGTSDKRT